LISTWWANRGVKDTAELRGMVSGNAEGRSYRTRYANAS
jgi:hypothetical protein